MGKFAKYLAIVLAATALLDACNRIVCSLAFSNLPQHSKIAEEYKFVTNDTPAEIVIAGASRAFHHYVPHIIADALGTTCFNTAYDGKSIVNNYLSIVKACDNSKVSTVILDVSNFQFDHSWVDGHISDLYPYYWSNDSARTMVDIVKPAWTKALMLSSFVQYNSNLYDVLRANITVTSTVDGYDALPDSEHLTQSTSITDTTTFRPDPIGIDFLNRTADYCRKNGIRLILIYSPTLDPSPSFTAAMKVAAAKNHTEFWNYSQWTPVTSHCEYFKDRGHMVNSAAELFTRDAIVPRLKSTNRQSALPATTSREDA